MAACTEFSAVAELSLSDQQALAPCLLREIVSDTFPKPSPGLLEFQGRFEGLERENQLDPCNPNFFRIWIRRYFTHANVLPQTKRNRTGLGLS